MPVLAFLGAFLRVVEALSASSVAVAFVVAVAEVRGDEQALADGYA